MARQTKEQREAGWKSFEDGLKVGDTVEGRWPFNSYRFKKPVEIVSVDAQWFKVKPEGLSEMRLPRVGNPYRNTRTGVWPLS